MKKIINKWKSLRKIEKIQFIVTLLVGVICLVSCICLLTCKKPKVEHRPVILTATDEHLEPSYFGGSTMNTILYQDYNGSYQNNFSVVACYRVYQSFAYYTMPFNIENAINDMLGELNALELYQPDVSYRCCSWAYSSSSVNLSLTQALSNCQNYANYLANGFYTPVYQSDYMELIDVSNHFVQNTKLLLNNSGFTYQTYTYFFVGVSFSFNTNDVQILSSVLPYSDSVNIDNYLYIYTTENIDKIQDFSNNWQEGYDEGLRQGRIEGANSEYSHSNGTIPEMMSFIFNAPVEFIKNAFDVEFMGINVAGIFLGFIAVLLVGWLIKKLL